MLLILHSKYNTIVFISFSNKPDLVKPEWPSQKVVPLYNTSPKTPIICLLKIQQ